MASLLAEQEINTEMQTEDGNASAEQVEQVTETSEAQNETGETTEAEQEVKAEVPESYEFTAPEGMEIDSALVASVEPVFKELGLTQEQASKLVSIYAEHKQNELASSSEALAKQVEQQSVAWVKELKSDPDFGGANFDGNLAYARKAITTFADPDFVAMLDKSGLGDNPSMAKTFAKIGKAISEDKFSSNSNEAATATYQNVFNKSNMNP